MIQWSIKKPVNVEQSFAKATDSKIRKEFTIRELHSISLIFYMPHYQVNRKSLTIYCNCDIAAIVR
jgi:hypothetical protein